MFAVDPVSHAYFTSFAHIAAGLAIAAGFVPRLAAMLEAIMESLFTLIVWGTAIVIALASPMNWVSFFASTALSAAAWALARSYRKAPGASQRTAAANRR